MHRQEKFLFVINPVSGGRKKQDWEAGIRAYFSDKPHQVQFFILTGKDDATSVQHHIDSFGPDRVIAVGGDGTIRLIATRLMGTNIPMGILPAGSANGMAKELNIPQNLQAALDIVSGNTIRKIDLIKVNDKDICIHLSDIGLNARIIKQFEEFRSRGWLAYGKALWKALWAKQKFRCTIKTDTEVVHRKVYMVVIANATKYGMGAVINPVGELTDAVFEVIVVRKLNFFAVLNGFLRGKPFHPEKIEILQTKSVEVTTQKKHHFQIDGEFLGKTTSVRAEILPQALCMILPENGTAF